MRWKITIEGLDEFSARDTTEMMIEKPFSRLSEGEIRLSISDGKSIMTLLQQLVVKQQCETYVLTSRYCTDCPTFRRIKDYSKRKIRKVYGRVEARCLIPGFDGAIFSMEWKDALWARFCMGVPARQRRCVERYNIVKRA